MMSDEYFRSASVREKVVLISLRIISLSSGTLLYVFLMNIYFSNWSFNDVPITAGLACD
jgi:hypothetical protein